MHTIVERLLAAGPVITDGAWGTQLQLRGLTIGECPDLWNLTEPDRVGALAQAYATAGSRVILTNTFGSNRINLARHGLAEKTGQLNRLGAELSRRAAREAAMVFGSIGPCGKMLMSGEVNEEELDSAFSEQALALAEGGVDGFVVETMTDLAEAAIAVAAARKTGKPVVASMAFDTGKERDRTMMGVTPEQAAKALAEAGADAVGANCGQGIEGFLPLCRRLRAATSLPVWLKPNAGLPTLSHGHAIYSTKPEEFARYVPELVKAGANFIGGCCGTSPDFIRAVREQLKQG